MKNALIALALAIVCGTATLAHAEAVPGPKSGTEIAPAHGTVTFNVTFRGGELAEVGVIGDGDTDLDLYVYDEFGNLVASDTDYTDACYGSWYPRWTGSFTIQVVNRGSVYNRFAIATN